MKPAQKKNALSYFKKEVKSLKKLSVLNVLSEEQEERLAAYEVAIDVLKLFVYEEVLEKKLVNESEKDELMKKAYDSYFKDRPSKIWDIVAESMVEEEERKKKHRCGECDQYPTGCRSFVCVIGKRTVNGLDFACAGWNARKG